MDAVTKWTLTMDAMVFWMLEYIVRMLGNGCINNMDAVVTWDHTAFAAPHHPKNL